LKYNKNSEDVQDTVTDLM